MTAMRTKLATLDCAVFTEEPPGRPRTAIICCHGFGAPGDDLVGLRDELVRLQPSLEGARFIFPAAPIDLGDQGYGFHSRAWWLIDFEQVGALQRGDEQALRAFRSVEPEGMAHSRALLRKLVDEVCEQTGLPIGRVVLMGFSQGAMLSTDLALRLDEAPLALAVLSGTLLTEEVWRQKANARAGLPVFQSHGRQDPILIYRAAEWLKELFEGAKMKHEFHPFDGGHGIPPQVLAALGAFLVRIGA